MSRATITPDGRVLHWTGEDGNPASSTVGMSVVLHRRDTTPAERAWYARLLRTLRLFRRCAERGLEPASKGRYGRICQIDDAWLAARPRVAT